MKGAKSWIWVVMLLAIYAVGLGATVWAQEEKGQTEDVKLLQVKIKKLEKAVESQQNTINRLRKELAKQTEENKRLLALCKKAGIQTAIPAKTSFDPGDIVYRGKERDKKWFDRMYERFYDKIVYIDGKYIDKSLFKLERMSGNKTWPKGSIVKAPSGCKVLQVLGPGEALILRKAYQAIHITGNHSGLKGAWSRISEAASAQPEILFHLTGYEGQLIDEQPFSFEGPLICIGTFEYTNTLGAQKTIQSFAVCKSFYESLTKQQFAEALSRGFQLVYYKKIGTRTIRRPIR
jgi:hypothetical protein